MLAYAFRSPNFMGFQQLSKSCQLIIADCLDKDIPYLDISGFDPNADYLCRQGWLVEEQSITAGGRSFAIPDAKWRELLALRHQILTDGMRSELARYRATRTNLFAR